MTNPERTSPREVIDEFSVHASVFPELCSPRTKIVLSPNGCNEMSSNGD